MVSGLVAQSFREVIAGNVLDNSGASIAGAVVVALETATNTTYNAVSSSARRV